MKRILRLMLPSRDFKTIKSQNNYCSIGARSILTISHYHCFFLAKLFTDDIDIGKKWMSFLNPVEEHVLIGELSGGGGFRVAISFRFSCDDSQFLYAVSSLCYNV